MRVTKKRVRKNFAPLTCICTIVNESSQGGAMQVFDESKNVFVPNRSGDEPWIFQPVVHASADDGSWHNGVANERIGNVAWFVNGKNIQELVEWNEKYTIETSGVNTGKIVIRKNIPTGVGVDISFSCQLNDNRTGRNVMVYSDVVTLATTSKSEDLWSVNINHPNVVEYNPFLDKLLIHEYKAGNKMSSVAPSSNIGTYKLDVVLDVFKGKTKVDFDEYDARLFVTKNNVLSNEKVIEAGAFSLDLRFIEKEDFLIRVYKKGDDKFCAQYQLTVSRRYSRYEVDIQDIADVNIGSEFVPSKVVFVQNNKVIDTSELFFEVQWYSNSPSAANVKHNIGERGYVDLARAGMDGYVDVDADIEMRGVYKELKDGSFGLKDNGKILIIN